MRLIYGNLKPPLSDVTCLRRLSIVSIDVYEQPREIVVVSKRFSFWKSFGTAI